MKQSQKTILYGLCRGEGRQRWSVMRIYEEQSLTYASGAGDASPT